VTSEGRPHLGRPFAADHSSLITRHSLLVAPQAMLSPSRPQLWTVSLGRRSYAEVLELQRAVARARISGDVPEDVLLLVEHPPVVTLGRATKERNVVSSPEYLASRGVELFEVERGGDVTFHGPGQLVGYPIVDLKRHRRDLHWYLRQVEEALILALDGYGIRGTRNAGYTGVWTGEPGAEDTRPVRKIASIGVHARDWVTWHGFALNVNTDLSYFGLIVPCGIDGVDMTSIARETGRQVDMPEVERSVANAFSRVFALEPISAPPDWLSVARLEAERA
jgi:lipoyl(octanoyl) transferase